MKKAKKLISALLGLCMTISTFSVMPVNARGELPQGDVDGNGKFSLIDMIAVNRWLHTPQFFKDWQYYGYQWKNADWNNDGKVNVIDLALMKRSLTEEIKILNPILHAKNLSASVNAQSVNGKEIDEDFILKQMAFYLNLMQKTAQDGTNTLISPYSVVQALAMTANGADGQTLSEMENVIGSGMSMDELNPYLYTQRINQPNTEKCKLLTANSIWCRDFHPAPFNDIPFVVKEDFLQTNKNFYNADVFTAPFDETTLNDINNWTNAHTDKMIPHLLENLPEEAVMALVNAVTFDAKWSDTYYDSYEEKNWFTDSNGTAQTADVLYGEEHRYLSDEHSTGFMKSYEGGRYAFVGILPEEGMTSYQHNESSVLTPQHQHQQEATLTDASQIYRICSSRPQRVLPTQRSKTERSIAITKIRDQYAVYIKYYSYFCRKITIIDKILRYDTRFLGKELSFHSRQAGIKLRGKGTFFRTCH